ncbi:MAG TPA: ABC transporter substrate-binding protein [Candidatus Limnocylindria bacterium]|nr:ABC transporter substrate-binding protein [Candidatus Limnocylindria bacterium]
MKAPAYRVSRRRFLRDSTLVSVGMIAASCAPGTSTPTATQGGTVKKGGAFHGAWPYQLPPAHHFNSFVSATAILGPSSIYVDLMQPNLGIYNWGDAKWEYLLAESTKTSGNAYEVKLRSGLKWSDGAAVSSKDVVTTYTIGRMEGFGIWSYIDKVEAVDDLTVRFTYKTLTTLGERLILRNSIRPDSIYGAIAKKAGDLFAQGKTTASDEVKAVRTELQALRPTVYVASGPYKMDHSTLTASQVTLVRNPGGLFADKVNFDKVVVYQGETAEVTPLVLAGDVDYATHGFPVATDKAMQDAGLRIVRGPLFTGPALYLHWEKAPQFQDKRLRQAVAHAINRQESGTIAYGQSARAPKYMAGYSDGIVENWISSADRGKLNSYSFDRAKADSLLREAGYAKGSDGIYAKEGKKLEFELYFPSDFADWSSAAEHASKSLNEFGIKITLRGAQRAQQLTDFNNGNFQIALNAWGIANPHPQQSLVRPIREYSVTPAGGGMKYPLKATTTTAGEIDWQAMLDQSAEGSDIEKQKPIVTKLTLAYNELLPAIPLWERLGNNPLNTQKRVAGWPPDGDKIYQQGGGDNFAVKLILDGRLYGK